MPGPVLRAAGTKVNMTPSQEAPSPEKGQTVK